MTLTSELSVLDWNFSSDLVQDYWNQLEVQLMAVIDKIALLTRVIKIINFHSSPSTELLVNHSIFLQMYNLVLWNRFLIYKKQKFHYISIFFSQVQVLLFYSKKKFPFISVKQEFFQGWYFFLGGWAITPEHRKDNQNTEKIPKTNFWYSQLPIPPPVNVHPCGCLCMDSFCKHYFLNACPL